MVVTETSRKLVAAALDAVKGFFKKLQTLAGRLKAKFHKTDKAV